ncbi:MAG: glycine/betaine ABC transporter permease, partial [Amylibacter sp.]|nr:glycine/betaine ABC transporter permease [Amylibacter sp.]
MAVTQINSPNREREPLSSTNLACLAIFVALSLCLLRAFDLLPAMLVRVPEEMIPPFADYLDKVFNFFRYTLKLEILTRAIAEGPLEFLLDTTANLLYGKRRWPNLGPIPWTAIAASAAVIGYYLGGWRLAVLAGGTLVWTALIGQWKIAMQTMSVLVVAAPLAF